MALGHLNGASKIYLFWPAIFGPLSISFHSFTSLILFFSVICGHVSCHLVLATSRLCDKYREVYYATYREAEIFRNGNRLCKDDIFPAKWENGIDFKMVSEASKNGGNDDKRIIKLLRSLNLKELEIR